MRGRSAGSARLDLVRWRPPAGRSGAGSGSSGLSRDRDLVAVEEPMELRVEWGPPAARVALPVSVTMRTPGHDFELAAGFLAGEGLLGARRELIDLAYCTGPETQAYNVVLVRYRPGVPFDGERLQRNFYATSSCGVCGKASLDAVEARGCAPLPPGPRFRASLLASLPDRLREAQAVFERTGGLHAAGLFDADGRADVVREDVGRHNAVDKVVGWRLLEDAGLPAADRALVVSGRSSFEIVQKAALAGIPVLVAVGAPSSLAVRTARRFQQTLVGFARPDGFNVYAGPERIAG